MACVKDHRCNLLWMTNVDVAVVRSLVHYGAERIHTAKRLRIFSPSGLLPGADHVWPQQGRVLFHFACLLILMYACLAICIDVATISMHIYFIFMCGKTHGLPRSCNYDFLRIDTS